MIAFRLNMGKETALNRSAAESKMVSWQQSLRKMLTWFLDRRTIYLDIDGDHVVSMIGDHLNRSFRFTDPSRFETKIVSKCAKPFDFETYLSHDPRYLLPIVKLYSFVNKKMKPYISKFFLHGSMATMDYCKGWSDVDTFVVINKKTLHNTSSLLQLRKYCFEAYDYLLQIDPLQHHGLIFVTEYDLEYYPSIYIPPPVFDHARSFLDGAEEITFHLRDSQEEAVNGMYCTYNLFDSAVRTGVFKHHAYQGEYLRTQYENADNAMYQFKYFLALVMSLPVLFLNLLGQSCYKRESFDRCKDLFGEEWAIIEKASEVRNLWPEKETFPFKNNSIPPWVQAIIGPNYFKEAFALIHAMTCSLKSAQIE